ncbi:MAG: hypothetical protein RL238_3762 [Actinomycetota bacterium]
MAADVVIRTLHPDEVGRVGEIDRTERIEVLFEQRGTELVERRGQFDAPAWYASGEGGHTVAAQVEALQHYLDAGGTVLGVFDGERMVGIGAVVPHLRPNLAQLAFLHVSAPARSSGIGRALCAALEALAREGGDREIVVTATPSEHTVRFYLSQGYRPMEHPLPELFELEPDDVHMTKVL